MRFNQRLISVNTRTRTVTFRSCIFSRRSLKGWMVTHRGRIGHPGNNWVRDS